MTEDTRANADVQRVLRHVVAAIAYRSSRVLRDVPEDFPELELGHGVRTPREIVSLNAGAALYAANIAGSIEDGMKLAREAIASGAARAKLDELVRVTNQFKA